MTPDGSRIVTGSYDKTARIWDSASRRELLQLKGHEESVLSVTVTPDGSRVVTSSSDKTVRIWDAASGRELAELEGNEATSMSIAVMPDGWRIVAGSKDKDRADQGDLCVHASTCRACPARCTTLPHAGRTRTLLPSPCAPAMVLPFAKMALHSRTSTRGLGDAQLKGYGGQSCRSEAYRPRGKEPARSVHRSSGHVSNPQGRVAVEVRSTLQPLLAAVPLAHSNRAVRHASASTADFDRRRLLATRPIATAHGR